VEGVVLFFFLLAGFGEGADGEGRITFLPITPRQAMDGIMVVMVDVVLTMRGGIEFGVHSRDFGRGQGCGRGLAPKESEITAETLTIQVY
jgi:hypothetical protein